MIDIHELIRLRDVVHYENMGLEHRLLFVLEAPFKSIANVNRKVRQSDVQYPRQGTPHLAILQLPPPITILGARRHLMIKLI